MDSLSTDLMMCLVVGVFAWSMWLFDAKQLIWALAVGIVSCSYFAVRVAKTLRKFSNFRLGLLGEQVVGQILDQHSSESVRVFHDLEVKEPGKKPWNIDHIVLTQAGVYAVETKARRKPRDGAQDLKNSHKITFDGQQLVFPAPMKADRHSLEQAQRNAKWLAEKLTALNGCPIQVAPVLTFPGWWVDIKGKGPVAVLNPKLLPGFLTGRPGVFSSAQFSAIGAQLEERCRIDLTL